MTDLREVEEYYRTLPDFEVDWIAWHEAGELEPDAVPILEREVRRRNLDPTLLQAIEIQVRGLSKSELESLLAWYRATPCPLCGKCDQPLNGCTIEARRGLVLFTVSSFEKVIGCADCLDSRLVAATDVFGSVGCLTGGLVGWFQAMGGARRNLSELRKVRSGELTAAFLDYVKFDLARLVLRRRASSSGGG